MSDTITFNAGDSVKVSDTLLNAAGKAAPQAGKQGLVLGTVRGGKVQVDVAGMPLLTVGTADLTLVAKAAAAPAGTEQADPAGADAAPEGAEAKHTDTPPVAGAVVYGFDVLLLTAIVPGRYQPRTIFDPDALEELADSIKAQGVAQPILVRPLPASRLDETFTDRRKGDPLPTHELVAGERRWRACKMAGVRTVPVLVRNLSDEQVAELQLVENVQRESLHPLEEARGYRRMMEDHGYTIERLAGRIKKGPKKAHVSTRYIYVTLQLLNLCDFAQQVFLEGKLERTTALQVATIGNEAQQIEATRRIAGLGAKGTEVVNTPLPLRAATEYVQSNFRLTLSKAPFNIKVELAGIAPCTGCTKNSANAKELFDNPNMPATCMDPSCYGKKNGAHTLQVVEAAKAEGQKVITGKEAKKILPYEAMPEHVVGNEYITLDERLYGSEVNEKHSGQTVAQVLGNDMPKPVLIQRPDGKGLVKALLRKDVMRLIKERGLGPTTGKGSSSEAEENKKIAREKAARWAVAEKLVATAGQATDCPALLSQLLLPAAMKLYARLDNEASKRVRKLMGWDIGRGGFGDTRKQIEAHFKTLTPVQFNQFVVAACMADEVHYAQYYHPEPAFMDDIGKVLGIDAKAERTAVVTAAKNADKAKEQAKAKKAAPVAKSGAKVAPGRKAGKANEQKFMAEMHCSPVLQAIVGTGVLPRTKIVESLWAYIKKHKLQDATNKRMVNTDDKLRAIFNTNQVSMFEMAGLIAKHVSHKPFTTTSTTAAAADAKPAAKKASAKKPASTDAGTDAQLEIKGLDQPAGAAMDPKFWPFPTKPAEAATA